MSGDIYTRKQKKKQRERVAQVLVRIVSVPDLIADIEISREAVGFDGHGVTDYKILKFTPHGLVEKNYCLGHRGDPDLSEGVSYCSTGGIERRVKKNEFPDIIERYKLEEGLLQEILSKLQ